MSLNTNTSIRRSRRRGGTYVLVMGSSMIVAVIGLAAVTVLRVERRYTQDTSDFASARAYALSAVEMGFNTLANDPNWRANHPNGIWFNDKAIGVGSYTLSGVDPNDADLANNDTDSLVLTGIGVQGEARYKLQVRLTAELQALSCLEVGLHTGGDITFSGATVQCNQIISSNGSISETSSTINANVEAGGTITGTGYTGTITEGITPRTMPDSTVFDYYLANGTVINLSDVPVLAGKPKIQYVVLSPANNPFGAGTTNPEGIYVLDCLAQEIQIQHSRIVGTLVLLNPDPQTRLENVQTWEPAIANYPTLLVSGSIVLDIDGPELSEIADKIVNYNPPGTPYPYPSGVSDTVLDDTYPSLIKGLVYVSGDVLINTQETTIDGVLVVGNTFTSTSSSGPNLTYQPTFLNNPPPGFTEPPRMVIATGSWQRVVD